MKRIGKLAAAALGATMILAMTGCVRDYSVSSYQGVMPIRDLQPILQLPPSTNAVQFFAPVDLRPIGGATGAPVR